MSGVNGYNLEKLVGQFQIVAEFVDGYAWTKGHINDTYIINCRRGGPIRYICSASTITFSSNSGGDAKHQEATQHLRKKCLGKFHDLTRRTMTLVPTRGCLVLHGQRATTGAPTCSLNASNPVTLPKNPSKPSRWDGRLIISKTTRRPADGANSGNHSAVSGNCFTNRRTGKGGYGRQTNQVEATKPEIDFRANRGMSRFLPTHRPRANCRSASRTTTPKLTTYCSIRTPMK